MTDEQKMRLIINRCNQLLSYFYEWHDSMSESEWQWIVSKCYKIATDDFVSGKLQTK